MDLGRLEANLSTVRRRIREACARAGRDPSEVTLVVVTKTAPEELFAPLAGLGVTDIGENRAVEGFRRTGALTGFCRHMVGRIQTNKVGKVLQWSDVLHSVDRPALLDRLEREGRRIPAYVQVNMSGEASKAGYAPEETERAVKDAARAIDVLGLMTMAPFGEDARPHFRRLREFAGRCGLKGLSMGMTQDFETAVEEGATCVRVGSAVFEDVF